MSSRLTMTREERTAYRAGLRAELQTVMDRAYGQLAQPGQWAAMLQTAANLRDRGPVNVIALSAQLPGVSDVRSRGDWLKAGRYPARGSHALRIWTPVRSRAATAPGKSAEHPDSTVFTESAEQARADVRAYTAGPVFDISQTAGDELAPTPTRRPTTAEIRDALHLAATADSPLPRRLQQLAEDDSNPQVAATALLAYCAGIRLVGADEAAAGQNAAEASSASHLAALILGCEPAPFLVPPLAGVLGTDPHNPPIKAAAVCVIRTGRDLADIVTGQPDPH